MFSKLKIYWITGWFYEFTKLATAVVFVFLLINYFFFSFFVVKGSSMEPTLLNGDLMLINKAIYYTQKPIRGDIIALNFPGEQKQKFVKRIIGLPGEKVSIINNSVYINDRLINENYLSQITPTDKIYYLEKNEYFVMGDNRRNSSDSRIWGTLPDNYIIGKATKIIHRASYEKLINIF